MSDPDISASLTEAERNRRADRAASASAVSVSTPASAGDYTVDRTPAGTISGNTVTLDASGRIPAGLIPAGSGGGGGGPETYEYVQAVPAQQWTIPHTLGGLPQVEVLNAQGQEINATVLRPDDFTVIIRFGKPYAGTAILTI